MRDPGFGESELRCARELIGAALREDGADRDLTTSIAVDPERVAVAVLRSRQPGVIAGLPCVELTLAKLDSEVKVDIVRPDGERCAAGDVLVRLSGRVAPLLTAERTFLNLIGPLSGTATLTRRFVDAVGETCTILDTRKTWPGARALQKYAVRCGGGENHRFGLHDAILLKDNHLQAGSSLEEQVRRARREHPGVFLEVEVDDLDQLARVLELDVDRIMLDNFEPTRIERAVKMRTATGRDIPYEVSGGVTLERAPSLAAAGADFLSIGGLTHSAPSLDVGLDLQD